MPDDDLPRLDPLVVADDEALAEVISRLHVDDPEVAGHTYEIAMQHTELISRLSNEDSTLFVKIEDRERILTQHLIRWAFMEGRRYPVEPGS